MSTTDKQLPLTNEAVAALAAQKYVEADSTEREAFLADPKGALEKMAGFALDADIEVRAVHNTADEVHVGIPAYHTLPRQGGRIPLDEGILDSVAGGVDNQTIQGAVTAAVTIANAFKKGVADRKAKKEADRLARMKSKKK